MTEPQGLILFEGINDILEATFSLTQGISPSVATLVIPPQKVWKGLSGNLTIRQRGLVAKFQDCRVDEIEQLVDPQGREVWIARILDRRWLWRLCGRVSGHYNFTRGTKIFNPKRPRELAELCLEAMGEKGADIKALPNDSFPETVWDYTNPAEALAALCDTLDCRVVLDVNDKLKVVKVNEGRPLRPNNRTLDGGLSVDPADPPGFITIVGAPTRFQVDFKLRPVGLDTDDKIRPIDRLSYTPKVAGRKTWRFSTYEDFQEVTNLKHRGLAQESVFRWYQVEEKIRLPGVPKPVSTWRVLPLLSKQAELFTNADGEELEKDPQVYGLFWPGWENHTTALTAVERDLDRFPQGEYTAGFSIDADKGLVKLNTPAVQLKHGLVEVPGQPNITSRQVTPAELYLRIAVNLVDFDTRGIVRVNWTRKPKGKKADPLKTAYIIREDTGLRLWEDWGAGGVIRSNAKEAAKAAKHYLDIETGRYVPKDGGSLTQAGLLKEDVDGAIVQVTWSVPSDGRAVTRISRTREDLAPGGDFKVRRLFERIDRALKDRAKREGKA